MIKGAIFDFDGTIADSMGIWENVVYEYMDEIGKPYDLGLRRAIAPMTLPEAADYLIKNYGVEYTNNEICDAINAIVNHHYLYDVQPKEGVREFLKLLFENNVKMCIATVTKRELVEEILVRWGLSDYFVKVLAVVDYNCSKHEPTIYRVGMETLGTTRENTFVFEDALYAAKTVKADGFKLAGIFDQYEKDPKGLKNISDIYVENFTKLTIDDFNAPTTGGCSMKTALSIAGSDSSGGAGIQADIKTMTMNGVFAMTAITALTAQNTCGVTGIMEVTPEFLKEQLDAVFTDIFPNAVKIGMVSSSALVKVIADTLKSYDAKNIVVDPVMVATSGSSLIKTDAIKTLESELLPISSVVTPNIPEAEILSEMAIETKEDMENAAIRINQLYGCSVLVKGGHSINDANDLLYDGKELFWFAGKRIQNDNTHGTGCTLSSAIASNLAKGFDLKESVQRAKDYISCALAAMLDLGKGSGPMKHNFNLSGKFTEEK